MVRQINKKYMKLLMFCMIFVATFFWKDATVSAKEIKNNTDAELCLETESIIKSADVEYYTENGINYVKEADGSVSDLDQGLKYTYDEKNKIYTLSGGYLTTKNIVIADTIKGKKVTAIGKHAFNNYVETVKLGKYVKTIEEWAFRYCTSIKTVELSDATTTIGKEAFVNSGLESITITKNVKTIGEGAFSYCDNLKEVTIQKGKLTQIPAQCFWRSNSLKEITLPSNVTKLGNNAFSECDSLETVEIKGKVKKIPYACFYASPSLKSVTMPSTLVEIDMFAFANTALEKVTIPEKVTTIGQAAFENCKSLKTLNIKGPVKEIKMQTFWNCTSLYQVVCSKKIKKISDEAFKNCNSNLTVVAPKNSNVYQQFYESNSVLVTDSKDIKFNLNTGLMYKGETKQISAYNYPGKLKWKSSNSSVIKITSGGKATAKKPGTATLTASYGNQKITMKMKVLSRTKANVLRVITAEYVRPEMTDYEKVVATNKWLVKNVKYDYSSYLANTIPASSYTAEGAFVKGLAVCNGYALAFKEIMDYYGIPCEVVVSQQMNHGWNAVKINGHWYHVDVTWNDPIVNGSNANTHVYTDYLLVSDKEFKKHYGYSFHCTTSKRSKVDKTYKTESATANATVKEKSPVNPYLNAFCITLAQGGDDFQLKITGTKAKKFTSSNKNVATVTSKGVIKAKKAGTAVIQLKGVNGKTYSCKVTVENPKINKTNITLLKGNSTTLKVTNTKEKIEWSTSNKKVATVTSKGKVNAVGAGTAKIVAKVNGKKMTCVVKVHAHTYQQKVTKQPTCTTKGVRTYTCSCGKSYTTEIAALGHNYQWIVTKKASAASAQSVSDFGTRILKCANCSHVKQTESIINVGGKEICGYFDDTLGNKYRVAINKYRQEEVYGYDPFGENYGVTPLPEFEHNEALEWTAKIEAIKYASTKKGVVIDNYPGGVIATYGTEIISDVISGVPIKYRKLLERTDMTQIGTCCFYYDSDGDGEDYVGYWVVLLEE